ncbi:phosphatase PAP2 family protein [Saprospira grandis]|uniref:phosphatase PAP2 family protein n=1 Tax=Saprospira grandis TaxID=1008 RepID=UPI0022DD1486|nr:phosphatase PAP2 family protein [Saprospira grandis]WBM73226.1 phosphatase PAP2 family protein [Saprospira grandis]
MQGFWTFWQKHQLYFHLMLWPILLGWIPALLFDKGDGVHFFLDFRGPKLNLFFRLFTQATEGFALLFCFGALLFIRLRYSLLFVFGTGLSLVLSQGLKLFFQFPRPQPYFLHFRGEVLAAIEHLPQKTSWVSSFPSGHSMVSACLFGLLALWSPRPSLQVFFALIALGVAFSRVYLGQHFLQDILSGCAWGSLLAGLIHYFSQDWAKTGGPMIQVRLPFGKS